MEFFGGHCKRAPDGGRLVAISHDRNADPIVKQIQELPFFCDFANNYIYLKFCNYVMYNNSICFMIIFRQQVVSIMG